ncbi:hypothetical protein [Paraburkholderia agricolaris]|uniref:hypothetical protein n=1 Tax=Paraburkholderia agricolaris TaxID=2152888 RepID=UPI001290A122|nr:hypothetical protein [Paraburkholderia agricolaris]
MALTWQFQLRITVTPKLAADLRANPQGVSHAALHEVLRRHHASLKCQFDAFADYVSEAEKQGTENYPLYQWTRQTIENPEKQAKYLQSFTLYVNGEEIYGKEIADVMEAELLALVSDEGIKNVARFDTNPANNPQPPGR